MHRWVSSAQDRGERRSARMGLWQGLVAVLIGLACAAPCGAGSVHSWTASTAGEFDRGSLEGTALDAEGRVVLGPASDTLWGPDRGVVWDLAPDGAGGAFVGLSSPGRALQLRPNEEPLVWYEAGEEGLIAAVVADRSRGLYLGLSPGGKLLHAVEPGRVEELGSTQAAFVWDLAQAADGTLWIATGQPGALLRRTKDGELKRVLETGDDPVRCIAVQAGGGAVIGTGGRGRVIRVGSDGRAFALLDADEAEIVAVQIGPDGTVWALAARGAKQLAAGGKRSESEPVRVMGPPPPGEPAEDRDDDDGDSAAAPKATAPTRFKTQGGGALYRITPEGDARKVWETPSEVPFGLVRDARGRWLVATGDEGRVHVLDDRGRSSMLLSIPSDQATALAAIEDGRVVVGGATDARVERIEPGLRPTGRYLSAAIDAGTATEWGRLSWEADLPPGAGLSGFMRGGNTHEPDETWSDWIPLDPQGLAPRDGRLSTRWVQVRLDLTPSRDGRSPAVRRLELFYTPRNRPPGITDLTVEPAGVVWIRGPQQAARLAGPAVAEDPIVRRTVAVLQPPGSSAGPVRKGYEYGGRTIRWKAIDPDGDTLVYRLEIRAEGRETWIPLANDLEEEFFSWDARGVPDGLYRARLTVRDAGDNPEGQGLDDQLIGPVFSVDHTRPSLDAPDIRHARGHYEVAFVARDPGGGVAAVEVALGAGEWQPLEPQDGVADSAEERYAVTLDPPEDAAAESRVLRVRVVDAAGNLNGEAFELR